MVETFFGIIKDVTRNVRIQMTTRRRGESDGGIVLLCRGAFDEPTKLALNYGVVYN